MDEHLRRQVTWLVVAGAVLCLIIYAGGRRSEVNRLRDQIAYGSPAQRLAAVERLVASQKLADAVTDSPRWVQDGVVEAVTRLGDLCREIRTVENAGLAELEAANMAQVAWLAATAALTREESRGAHYRSDFPEPRETWRRHILLRQIHGQVDISYQPVLT